jgi:hypothetical protein
VNEVDWKRAINNALVRTTGYQLRRAASSLPQAAAGKTSGQPPGDRLVAAPVVILCTLRSGSTLLRVLLNSHSEIHAPHEMHLYDVDVRLTRKASKRALREMGLDARQLEYLLWDRLLHRALAASGKDVIVDKTPNNVFIADRLRECWPDARFIFLLRHPGAIVRSREAYLENKQDKDANVEFILRYCTALESARQAYDGLTVRYEDLTADPGLETRRICGFLGLDWESDMIEYGQFEHGSYRGGLGDWSYKIRTGRVQAPEPPPKHIPAPLLELSATWGYS